MACFWLHQHESSIKIPKTEEIGNVTFYIIEICVGEVSWQVTRRYNEFYELHNQLIIDHGVVKDDLPPKRVIRNKCPVFIESRRQGLESYLQKLLAYLKRTMPKTFVEFLQFNVYDIFFLLQNMALQFYNEADSVLLTTNSYKLNPLQLYSMTECLKNPFPAIEQEDKRCDFSHVLDFCSQLKELTIVGIKNNYLHSNIVPNLLPLEFTPFKNLHILRINQMELDHIQSLGGVRNTLNTLIVFDTKTVNISQILQCDVLHKVNVENNQKWSNVKHMDLTNNNIALIDDAVKLVPNIEVLILNQNKISEINDLSFLTKLNSLYMSNNLLTICDNLHLKLGNIKLIDFSQNSITSLQGFVKLYSLETLNVSCNKITDITEIKYISELPCLENLIMSANPVATIVDYRIKVLEHFGDRAKDIYLDIEKPTQPELDKVQVLRALRIVKEGKTPNLNNSRNM